MAATATIIEVVFSVPFVKGKQRPRVGKGGNVYTPANTKRAEEIVAEEYIDASLAKYGRVMKAAPDKEVILEVHTARPLPASIPSRVIAKPDFGGPDIDNVLKLVADGLNGTAYTDDRQVTEMYGGKELRTRGITAHTDIRVLFTEVKED